MESAFQDYFTKEYKNDCLELEGVDRVLNSIWETLVVCRTDEGWPYEVSSGIDIKNVVKTPVSSSTQSMVLFALGAAAALVSVRNLFPLVTSEQLRPPEKDKESRDFQKQLEKVFEAHFASLCSDLTKNPEYLESSSFGENNPFTLTWLLSLTATVELNRQSVFSKLEPDFIKFLGQAVQKSTVRLKGLETGTSKLLEVPLGYDAAVHSFPALRALQLCLLAKRLKELPKQYPLLSKDAGIKSVAKVENDYVRIGRGWFLPMMLEHLAYASIPDAPFDAAELAFSLEGYLLCEGDAEDGKSHDPDVIKRVFEVLRERQDVNPYWRPLKPMVTNNKGFALLPLSVEIVNSLFRTCWLLGSSGEDFFTENVQISRRYYEWIITRKTNGVFTAVDGKETKFTGWHSEHVQQPGSIHIWETSQVAVYLLHYREMLQKHLSRRSLQAARLNSRKIKRKPPSKETPEEYWEQEILKKDPSPNEREAYTCLWFLADFKKCRVLAHRI